MKTLSRIILTALMLQTSTAIFAQEWTKEQAEVWRVIENNWKNLKAGNVDPSVLAFHEKYQGWSSSLPLPINKDQAVAMFQPLKDAWKMQDYFINPARIAVASNAAVVHYIFQFNMSMGAGEESKMVHHQGKYTEFYVKENGKWMCLGDMTVYEDE